MKLQFNGSKEPTIGIEIEFQIIDSEDLDLTPQSEKILRITKSLGDTRITKETQQSMIEINSEISRNIAECRSFLKSRIHRLLDVTEELGLKLAITGTHPFQKWSERLISNHDRYQNLHKKYQWLFQRMNVYGLHVHIGVENGDKAMLISKELIQYLPLLIALSANSPYWQEIDTGMKSSRITILESFPFSKPPLYFSNWHELESYYSALHDVQAIQSLKDLYWHVRPNPVYGTIEIRICDAISNLTDTMAITALIQCLVVSINESIDQGLSSDMNKELFWISPENNWIAARDGLDGLIICDALGKRAKISDLLLQLVHQLSPIAKKLDCEEELLQVKNIIAKGNGADRQRIIYSKTNSLQQVVLSMMDEFYSDLFAIL